MSTSEPDEPPRDRRDHVLQPDASRHWGPGPNSQAAARYTGNYITGEGRAHLGNVYNYYGTVPAGPGPGVTHPLQTTGVVSTAAPTYQVPFSLDGIPIAPKFIARDDEIAKLETIFLEPSDHGQKICVVHGLGGIGKTQLCAQFARKHSRKFTTIIWLDASSKDALEQSIERCAERIFRSNQFYQGLVRTGQTLGRATGETGHTAFWRLNAWLSEVANNQWLLIFDNLDRDCRSGSDPLAFDYSQYIPFADHGNVLINSRISTLHAEHRLALGPASRSEALAMLEARAGRHINDADPILDQLGGLPLAIVQAGSFLGQHNMSASNYLAMYKSKWGLLMETQNEIRSQDYGERSILTTWAISRDHAAERDINSAGLLQIWAYLDSREIWYELIDSAWYAGLDSRLPEWYYDLTSHDTLAFQKAIGVLLNYSLIEVNEDGSSWAMHPVLHSWNRHTVTSTSDSDVLVRMALAAVSTICDDVESAPRLLPHAQSHISFLRQLKGTFAGLNLGRIACLLSDHKMFSESQKCLERALELRRSHLPAGNLWTLTTMIRLGKACATQGKFDQARMIFERALAECEDKYGADHGYGLGIMAYLGRVCQDQEDIQASERWFYRALNIATYSMAFGPQHKVTISFYDDLGGVYLAASRFADAEIMYLHALRGRERMLGPNDPLTHDVVFHLGRLYHYLGRSTDAEAMYFRAYRGRAGHFGLNSKLTQNTLRSLGTVYIEESKYDEAEDLYLDAQSHAMVLYGEHDQSTLFVCQELGSLYEEQQLYPKAEKMYLQVIEGYQKTVGLNHGDTVEAERRFAIFLTKSGRLLLALKMLLKCKQHYELSDQDGDFTTKPWIELVEECLEFCQKQNISEARLVAAIHQYGSLSKRTWPYMKSQLRPDGTSGSEPHYQSRQGTRRDPDRVVRFEGSVSSVSVGLGGDEDRYSDVGSLPPAPEHDNNEPIPTYDEFVAESNVATVADPSRRTTARPQFQAYAESLSTESSVRYIVPVIERHGNPETPHEEHREQSACETAHEPQSGIENDQTEVDLVNSTASSVLSSEESQNDGEMGEVEPDVATYREASILDWLATAADRNPAPPEPTICTVSRDHNRESLNQVPSYELAMSGVAGDQVEQTSELPVRSECLLSNADQPQEAYHDAAKKSPEMLSTSSESSVCSGPTQNTNVGATQDEEGIQTTVMLAGRDLTSSNMALLQEAYEDVLTETETISTLPESTADSIPNQDPSEGIGPQEAVNTDPAQHVQDLSLNLVTGGDRVAAATDTTHRGGPRESVTKAEACNTRGSKSKSKHTAADARQNSGQVKMNSRPKRSHTRRRSSQKKSACVIQ